MVSRLGIPHQLGELVIAIMVAMMVVVVNASEEFPVYRVLQFSSGGSALGCHRASLNLLASSPASAGELDSDVARKVSVLSYKDVIHRNSLFEQRHVKDSASFVSTISANASAVLVLLPGELAPSSTTPAQLSSEEREQWRAVEHNLLSYKLAIPFYVTHETAQVASIMSTIARAKESLDAADRNADTFWSWLYNSALANSYQLVVNAKEPSPISTISLHNVQGWVGAGPGETRLPVIVIVAHYDSMSAVPSLSYGGDSNASGVVALLHIARLLHKLAQTTRLQSKYNVVFLLADGGALNYAGTLHWLEQIDAQLASAIEVVICLDSLASASETEPLYLHTSRPEKDPVAKRLYDTFRSLATPMREHRVVQKRVVSKSDVADWEHEHFSRSRILASTFSHHDTYATTLFGKSSVLDSCSSINTKALETNIRTVAEVIASFMFNSSAAAASGPTAGVFEGSLALNPHLTAAAIQTLCNVSRAFAISPNPDFVSGLSKLLGEYTTDVTTDEFKLSDTGLSFYPSEPESMSAHVVKPYLFDVVFALLMILYMIALHVFVNGKEAIDQFVGIFNADTKRRK